MAGVVRLLVAMLIAVLAIPAQADDTAPVYAGVWQGSIGDLPVRVCLDRHEYQAGGGRGFGVYYYLRHLKLIPFEQQGDSRAWNENPIEGKPALAQWRFETVSPALLTARWTQGDRVLPVRLTRMATSETDNGPCGSLAFNQPRLPPVKVAATSARKDGVAYTKLALVLTPQFPSVEVATFALNGRTPTIARVNALLRKPLNGDAAHSEWYECIAGQLSSMGNDGDYSRRIEPTLITGHWLATEDSTGFDCGGPHPDNAITSHLYDLDAGIEADPYGWLNARAVERDGDANKLQPAFRSFVIARSPPIEADCRAPVAEQDYWDMEVTRAGLSFTPLLAHVMAPCSEPILVRFDRLTPWLSERGRTEVARFRREVGG